MSESYYKIAGNKIIFSDRRFDFYRKEIFEVFRIADSIDGTFRNPISLEEAGGNKFTERINLIGSLREKINDCLHKTEAVGYSLSLIKLECSMKITSQDMRNYSQMIDSKMCGTAEIKNEVLIYEVESFLFQIKSNFDILIQLLKHLYTYLNEGKGRDSEYFKSEGEKVGLNTIKRMRKNGDIEMSDFFQKQVNDWFQELNEMRNEITHRSSLKGFSSFTYKSSTDVVKKPTMPNGDEVDEYCTNVYKKLLCMYKEVFTRFVIPKNLDIHSQPYI